MSNESQKPVQGLIAAHRYNIYDDDFLKREDIYQFLKTCQQPTIWTYIFEIIPIAFFRLDGSWLMRGSWIRKIVKRRCFLEHTQQVYRSEEELVPYFVMMMLV